MSVDPSSLTTAYASNLGTVADSKRSASGWDPVIDGLRGTGYQFLPLTYRPPGCLVRGISAGLDSGLADGRFASFDDSRPICRLERELGVLFLSQDLSDAVSVARLWEPRSDHAVLVVPALAFEGEWLARRAAVLGFAEPGVVFRYPLLVRPIDLSQIALIVTSAQARIDSESIPLPVLALPDSVLGDRTRTEAALSRLLQSQGITPARPVATDVYPGGAVPVPAAG